MSSFSPLTQQLINALCCLPGVGTKSAQRMAFHLLEKKAREKGQHLSESLTEALSKVGTCSRCQTYTEQEVCDICTNPKRNQQLLCIVESPADIIALEHTHTYNGCYYVLHGHLSPLDGIGPGELRIPELLDHVAHYPVKEIIIATNPTMEGKATAHYIASNINKDNITISQIAYGVPLGGEIEYLDGHTLAHALQTRLPFIDKHKM
jgi:recombination protein RecR